jgi:hypothetical protein
MFSFIKSLLGYIKSLFSLETVFGRTARRGFEALVSVILAGIAVEYGDSQWFVAISPAFMMLTKWWRETHSK